MAGTPTVGLLVTLEAKPGKESAVQDLLASAQALVEAEPATLAWFAIKLGPSTFGIFDAFPDEAGRDAHLNGKVAQALKEQGPDLFVDMPNIQKCDLIGVKLPA